MPYWNSAVWPPPFPPLLGFQMEMTTPFPNNDCNNEGASEALHRFATTVTSGTHTTEPFGKVAIANETGSSSPKRHQCLHFKPEERAETTRVADVSQVFRYADRLDVVLMSFGAVCAFLAGAGMPGLAEMFGHLLQSLTDSPSDIDERMTDLALIMVYIGIGLFVLSFFQVFCWMLAGQRQVARIRLRFFEAVLRQDIEWHDEHPSGELTTCMDGNIRVLQNGIDDKLSSGILQLGLFVFGFGFGFYHSWQLTLVMLGTLPLVAFVASAMTNVMTQMTEASREQYATAGKIANEVLGNLKTVQIYGREEYEVQRFCAASAPSQRANIRREFANSTSIGLTYFVMFCSYAVAFWFASYLIEWGDATIGDITSAFFAVLMGSFGLGRIFPSVSAFVASLAAAHKVLAVIDRIPKIDIYNRNGVTLKHGMRDGVEFHNVNFAYPSRPDSKLFEDLTLYIRKGESVAFSGMSGCGKSSLIQLLQRYYDPDGGSITVDGVGMRDLNLRWWRDQIGFVSQEFSLFSGTVSDNVRVGKPDATDGEVFCACKTANVHNFIMTLPDKYDTRIGANGSLLSGGQKQRLAIARAIVKNPSILILDEATSALDRQSEMEVQAALDGIIAAGGLTVLVIAHRLATIRNVNTIHFMIHDNVNGSRIVESGSYDELMAHGRHFRDMARAQATVGAEDVSSGVMTHGFTCGDYQPTTDGVSVVPVVPQVPVGGPRAENDADKCSAEKEVGEATVPHARVLRLLSADWWAVLLGLLGSAVSGGLYPAYAVVIANMFEVLGKYADRPTVLREKTPLWAGLFIAIAGAALIGWMLQAFYAVAGERLTRRLREMVFRAILRQDAAFFDVPGHDVGAMGAILSGDCEAVHQLWGPSLGLKIQMSCNLVAGLVVALIYQWKLALVTACGIPAIAISAILQQALLVGFDRGREDGNSVDSIRLEALANIRTVAAFNMQHQQVNMYRSSNEAAERAFRNSAIVGLIFGLSQFMIFGVFALSYWYAGQLMKSGEADFLDVVIASTAVLMGALGAGEAGGFASKLQDAAVAAKRVFFLLDLRPPIDSSAGEDIDVGAGCAIAISDLRFQYPARPDVHVLRGLSTSFNNGAMTGVMGQSGCGKSTIIQLLSRFYQYEGSIRVNGKDLKGLNVAEWRSKLAAVFQEPALFSGSVRDNIKYSRMDATDEEVYEAARLAAIHEDILLMPNGYETDVGYSGLALSGGQKQRVAIARALLRNPRLLLLDEATSALDNATEGRVQSGLAKAVHTKRPMTIISVAHRLTTIREADKIILMNGGVIIEEGSHDELMALNGQYRERWELYRHSND